MGREMMAAKIEPEEEFFGPEQREELRLLRVEQMNMKGEFPKEKLERFLALQNLQKEADTGFKPLSVAEHAGYLELSKKDEFTPEESARFTALQTRLDKAGRAAV